MYRLVMDIKIKREAKCDMCQKLFYRKLTPPQEKGGEGKLTQINEVSYWLKEGERWESYEILCRGCLNDWFEKYRGDFAELVDPKKQKLYYHYRYLGLLSREKEFYKGGL